MQNLNPSSLKWLKNLKNEKEIVEVEDELFIKLEELKSYKKLMEKIVKKDLQTAIGDIEPNLVVDEW